MNAMEKMVANMLGLTPEKLASMIGEAQTIASTLAGKLEAIQTAQSHIFDAINEVKETQREILAKLEVTNDANSRLALPAPKSRKRNASGGGDDNGATDRLGGGGGPLTITGTELVGE